MSHGSESARGPGHEEEGVAEGRENAMKTATQAPLARVDAVAGRLNQYSGEHGVAYNQGLVLSASGRLDSSQSLGMTFK